jgi:UDP-N-acetylmuramate dehydrogenase
MIVGAGSNLLLTKDYPHTVFHSKIKLLQDRELKKVPGIENDISEVLVDCGSGETFDDVIAWCVKRGIHGLENLSLIPGDVGSSAVQNIGAYGVEVGKFIFSIEVVDVNTGEYRRIFPGLCQYGYRHSIFKDVWRNRYIITHVTFKLSRRFAPVLDYGNVRGALAEKLSCSLDEVDNKVTPQLLRDTIIEIRRNKLPDPVEYGNAGSFFMNPVVSKSVFEKIKKRCPELKYFEVSMPEYPGDKREGTYYKIPAGWLIDQCGLKGMNIGKAGVWHNQALILYNRGGATGDEIVALMKHVQAAVKEKFGIDLKPEVNVI